MLHILDKLLPHVSGYPVGDWDAVLCRDKAIRLWREIQHEGAPYSVALLRVPGRTVFSLSGDVTVCHIVAGRVHATFETVENTGPTYPKFLSALFGPGARFQSEGKPGRVTIDPEGGSAYMVMVVAGALDSRSLDRTGPPVLEPVKVSLLRFFDAELRGPPDRRVSPP